MRRFLILAILIGAATLAPPVHGQSGPPTVSCTTPNGEVTVPYTGASCTASGGSGSGYTFCVCTGTLPPGVTLNAAGVFSGTPTSAGTFNFTVKVTDSAGGFGTTDKTIT